MRFTRRGGRRQSGGSLQIDLRATQFCTCDPIEFALCVSACLDEGFGNLAGLMTGPRLGKLSHRKHEGGSSLGRRRRVRDQADFGSVPDDLGACLTTVSMRLAG
ncbi:hypothetical protein, partial [Actinoplanes sp. NPDC089786]|uniref:hypothetical protein n=1 Tax=Actinoplanes sp. NPDC089786 TaxID=3155185 RepID=UPI00341C6572